MCVADVLWCCDVCRDAVGVSIGFEGLGESTAGDRWVGDSVGGHGSHQAGLPNSQALLQITHTVQASSQVAYPRPGGVHVREARTAAAQGLEAPPVQSPFSGHGLHKDMSTGQMPSLATGKTHTSRDTHGPYPSPTVPATLVLKTPSR